MTKPVLEKIEGAIPLQRGGQPKLAACSYGNAWKHTSIILLGGSPGQWLNGKQNLQN